MNPTKHLCQGGFAFALLMLCQTAALAQVGYEKAPINYAQAPSNDPVAKMMRALDSGELELEYSEEHGWLPAVLEQLGVDAASQVLVFSKTSLQLHRISPRTPRAVYFNDDVYVGWCQKGDKLELAATDSKLGAVFYTMDQTNREVPTVHRDRGGCLTCHATYRTQGVPGYLVRSIYSDNNGRPRGGTRTYVTDHTSDFSQRYGGWYVSGDHGEMRHMGNAIARDRLDPEAINREDGANRENLKDYCSLAPYLTEHSDLVALMILEHQSQMHNLIARASMETRIARHYDRGINEALERPLDTISDSTKRRIASAGDKLVEYMLFCDEFELEAPVTGSSQFAEYFQELGAETQADSKGRSLRELDLGKRMFKYPCSYLIYTQAFDELPDMMSDYVRKRLSEVLTADQPVEGFEHLTDEDRQSIREILDDTKPGYLITPAA